VPFQVPENLSQIIASNQFSLRLGKGWGAGHFALHKTALTFAGWAGCMSFSE
jgi:hypothetical protein